jgi:ribosomal protein L16/L10AE
MTEMTEKKGRMKVTVELEVNEELMDVVKEAMSKASSKIPEMMRRGGNTENKP